MNMRSRPALFSYNEARRDRTSKKNASRRILLGILAVAVLPAIVFADEKTCRGELGGASVDNLRVPNGETCFLNRTRVKGSIKVESRAALHAHGVRVGGNVQAENARMVSVTQDSRIGGNVQVKQGASASVVNSTVEGDIQYEANRNSLRVTNNKVGGNVQVIGNQARAEIYRNVIDGNLDCKENRPRPTGGGNRVHGNKENQCSNF